MSRQAHAVLAFSVALTAALAPAASRAATISTQTAVLPATSTNFEAGKTSVSPLTFAKFDTADATRVLDSVDLSFQAAIKNDFNMTFATNGKSTITTSVATGDKATPGPTITLFQPDGVHPLLSVKAPNDPALLSRSVTYDPTKNASNVFGSALDPSNPNYLAPTVTTAPVANTLHLTSPSDLALFTGKGFVGLPVSAQAFSSFLSSSGNGFGKVTTTGTAEATVTYKWHDQAPAPQITTPEPASVVLWAVVGTTIAAGVRARRKRV